MKKDGKCIYLCIENQSINRKDVKARIHLYNALSYLTAIDKDGYTIPVITVLVLWGRDEGWRDTSAFNFRKEHIKDYLEFLPVYSIPTISILDLNEEELEEMNDDLRIASYAVKIAKGRMSKEEKMKCFEKLKKLFRIVSDEAKDLTLVYTGVNATKEEVMENGFDAIWEKIKSEGMSIGENKGILKCILSFQKKNNCTFNEAAEALDISKETVAQIKEAGLF